MSKQHKREVERLLARTSPGDSDAIVRCGAYLGTAFRVTMTNPHAPLKDMARQRGHFYGYIERSGVPPNDIPRGVALALAHGSQDMDTAIAVAEEMVTRLGVHVVLGILALPKIFRPEFLYGDYTLDDIDTQIPGFAAALRGYDLVPPEYVPLELKIRPL
jgi:hypothetical protein